MIKSQLARNVFEWWEKNKEHFAGKKVTNLAIANVIYEKCDWTGGNSIYTVEKYITKIRSGEYTREVLYGDDNMLDRIKENIETSKVFFGNSEPEPELDRNPLGVLPEPIDIKKTFFDIPETYADYKAPLKLDHLGKRMGVVSDIHFPVHDRIAVLTAHAYLKEANIDCLMLLGDILDCSNLTRHPQRKSLGYTWREELEVGRAYVKSLRVLFPDIPIIWLEGNHDRWLQQYIIRNCRELEGDYILRERLKLAEHDIQWVDEMQLTTFGNLYLTHGHQLGIGGGRNVATRLLDKHGVNLMIGHFHREQHDEKRTLDTKVHGVWVNSCLADVHPSYNPHNSSTHGFSIIDLHEEGMFTVKQYKIFNGKVIG